MITPAWCRMMASYNAEMNRRFYAAAAQLPDAVRRRDEGAFFGSLHRTLCHLLWGDMAWMARFDGGPPPPAGLAEGPEMIAEFEALREARIATDARITAWAAGVDEPTLAGTLRWYSQAAGREMERPMAMAVTHLFLHQNHHRGQAHALLTRAGADTGATDLPFVLP
ncbi:DinB family protein [Roseomonas marmotae]|uniref:DinB family protein n=1 Tax=Roseomonas marmotae TaxID=2768161 RepID=A0ABS3KD55_9PROT|nr:DinB family protein [Roseomonas marmotae]MBO1074855.1 DinB family protein [Roseomonas marmotae]QTI80640.1 DinB family protein [Roseomonas marmotae]